jgi:hypothetical protein
MAESITLQTSDSNVQQSDVLGRLSFAASNESNTSDARLIGASIKGVAESDFTEIANPTSLVFSTASSETATDKIKITSSGHFLPINDRTYDIGSPALKFKNIYGVSGNLDILSFNTNIEPDLLKGEMGWNDTEGTVNIALTDNTDIHIGEHSFFRIRNTTNNTLYKGQVVYASGVHSNGIIEPNLYAANGNIREVRFMGIVLENLNNNNNGYAIQFGHLENIDTRGNVATNYSVGDETWSAGDILYVHPTVSGKLTKNEPKHSISAAIVLDASSNGRIFVRPTSYGHLNDNHDVDISGATGGQFLQYNSATDYWVPSSSGNFSTLLINGTDVPSGVGENNYVTKWIETNKLGTGIIYDNGTNVGIGTNNPTSRLHVEGTGIFKDQILIKSNNTPTSPGISFSGDEDTGIYSGTAGAIRFSSNGARRFTITSNSLNFSETGTSNLPVFTINDDTDTGIFTDSTNTWCVSTNATERFRIDTNGNIRINGANAATSAVGAFHIKNGTAPTASITDGVVIYAQDVSGSSELRVRDESGNITTLSPHNFSLIPDGPSESMAWSFYSEKDGKKINVDMLKVIRLLEKLTGEKLVYEN